ncbi:MAG: septum formation initiator family protein [Alloprevotella sp.]
MKSRLYMFWNFLSHYKYLIVVAVGVAIVGFLDENSFMRRMQLEMEISDLQAEVDAYNAQNEADMKQLHELRRNPNAIEKIARERYFMKEDDEDIFVLSDDRPATDKNRRP